MALFHVDFVEDPVLDNLTRALASVDEDGGLLGPTFVDGIGLALAYRLVSLYFGVRSKAKVSPLSTLNGVSDGLDVRGQSTSSLCTEAACNISLQVGRSEGVPPGSTINEVHVISSRG